MSTAASGSEASEEWGNPDDTLIKSRCDVS